MNVFPAASSFVPCAVAGAFLAAAAVGCVSDVATPPSAQTFWEATLQGGIEWPDVQGSAAAVSNDSFTEAGILMSGLQPGSYAWRVREAACDAPGGVVGGDGQYPDLEVESDDAGDGPPTAMVATPRFRAGMDPAGEYHVEVRASDGDRVACGNFVRQ